MFIGEAPGKKENETGRPFVGAAGKFLAEMLESIGLTRDDVFIANTLKYQPPENRDPEPAEIEFQKPFLMKQIAIIQPKLICFLGRHALAAIMPDEKRTISQLHGQLILAPKGQGATSNWQLATSQNKEASSKPEASSQKPAAGLQAYLPLYHPAAALYNGSMRATLLADFSKIPEYMDAIKAQ